MAHVAASALENRTTTTCTRQSSAESEVWHKGPHWSQFNGPVTSDECGHPLANSSVDLPSGSVRPSRYASDSGACDHMPPAQISPSDKLNVGLSYTGISHQKGNMRVPSRNFRSDPGCKTGMPMGEAKEDHALAQVSQVFLQGVATTHSDGYLWMARLSDHFEFMWSDIEEVWAVSGSALENSMRYNPLQGKPREMLCYMVYAINFAHKATASFLFGYFTYSYISMAQVCGLPLLSCHMALLSHSLACHRL